MRKLSLFLILTAVLAGGVFAASINTTRSNIKHSAMAVNPSDSATMNSPVDAGSDSATSPVTNTKRSQMTMGHVMWTTKSQPGSDSATSPKNDATLQNGAAGSATIGTCRTCSGACSSFSPPKCACATASSNMTTATKCPDGCTPQKNGDCNCGDPNNAGVTDAPGTTSRLIKVITTTGKCPQGCSFEQPNICNCPTN